MMNRKGCGTAFCDVWRLRTPHKSEIQLNMKEWSSNAMAL